MNIQKERNPRVAGLAHVRTYLQRALEGGVADNTQRAYQCDLREFWKWAGRDLGMEESYPVAPETVTRYVSEHLEGGRWRGVRPGVRDGNQRAGRHAIATVVRRVSTLRIAHQIIGLSDPCTSPEVRQILRRARREESLAQRARRKAITREVLEAMLDTCDASPTGVRDRAILLVAFSSGGRRRSEVAALTISDLTRVSDGYLLCIGRSKTDQIGQGHTVPVLGRAATALQQWLDISGIGLGRLFRSIGSNGLIAKSISDRTIARMVKRRVAAAGYNPREYSAHSIRAGFITESARQKISLGDAMALSGHKTASVALRYYRAGSVLANPAARLIG